MIVDVALALVGLFGLWMISQSRYGNFAPGLVVATLAAVALLIRTGVLG